MEKLKNYKHKTDIGEYVSERTKVDKGVYDFKIFSDQNFITEEKNVKMKTGRDLEKYIRKVIKNYEENLMEIEEFNTEEFNEIEETEEMQEAIDELNEEEVIEEIDEEKDLGDDINAIFTKKKSPLEMQELFEKLDIEIGKIDGVSFKATTADFVYMVSGQNFLRIRPKPKRLDILHAPDYYKDIIKLVDDNEIDDAMVLINESCEFIREKRSKA